MGGVGAGPSQSWQELTGRNRRHVPTAVLVEDLNQYLRGWRQYYRFGNSTHRFATSTATWSIAWRCWYPNGTADEAEATGSSSSSCRVIASGSNA